MTPAARAIAVAVALAALTVLAFAGVRRNEFLLFDDVQYLTSNAHVQHGFTKDSVTWAFTNIDASNWHPLTWLSHMLDWRLFGANPAGHHLVGLGLHVASAVLAFWVLFAMTGALGRSAAVAALFAVHPLHVESVVYAAERKDVLSGLFFWLTLAAYVAYVRRPSRARYAVVAGTFALGLMAKSMLVTVPFVLLLLDVWPLGRAAGWRVVVEKVPLLLVAVLTGVLTVVAQSTAGAVASIDRLPVASRLANGVLAYVAYVRKTIWPSDLACFYPLPKAFVGWQVALAAAALLAVTVAAFALRRRVPYLFVGWCWFAGMLVPVSGLFQVGQQALADRFTYLPLVGLFIVAGWGGYDALARIRQRDAVLGAATAVVLVLCVWRTRVEVGYWHDSITLFERALSVTPSNALAHNNLGIALRYVGRETDALAHFNAALAANPDDVTARNHVGVALRALGRTDEALTALRETVARDPTYMAAHFNLGETLMRIGDAAGAEAELRTALRLDPNDALTLKQLGFLRRQQGDAAEAIELERRSIAIDPTSPEAHHFLADALVAAGRLDEAAAEYRAAQRLRPEYADAYYNLGNVLAQRGDLEGAARQYALAVQYAPGYAEAHNNLGRTFALKGDLERAIAEYSEALRFDPTLALAYYNRGKAEQQLGRADAGTADLARAAQLDARFRQ